jgi:hypothetical protein
VKGLIATAVVALVIHWMADPVPGLGIAVPVFMPALVTAAVALLLSRKDAPPLAYTLSRSIARSDSSRPTTRRTLLWLTSCSGYLVRIEHC